MSATSSELTWLTYLLDDLHILILLPITLHCDNSAAMHIVSNPVYHERTKHIELDSHVVQENIQSSLIKIAYVSGKQVADIITKSLCLLQFTNLLSKLGAYDLYSPA